MKIDIDEVKDLFGDVEFDFYASSDPQGMVIMSTLCLEVWIMVTGNKRIGYRAEKMHRVLELCQSSGPGDMSTMVNMFDGSNMKLLHHLVKPSGRDELIDWLERFLMTQHPEVAEILEIKPKGVA